MKQRSNPGKSRSLNADFHRLVKTVLAVSALLVLPLARPAMGADFYVSPSGNDSNPGTISQPFATPQKALTVIASGDTIYLRAGTYNLTAQLKPAIAGTAGNYCELWAFSGEKPVLNFAGTPSGTKGLYLSKDYWHVKGIEVANATDNGIIVAGCGFNIVEGCVIHDSNNDGLRLGSSSAVAHDTLILNCDSYRNFQASSGGNNGDGFAAKVGTGSGNVFRGCRAWNNSDDGWDFYDNDTSSVTLDGCWAFANGLNVWGVPNFSGNGNGFKLGGASTHAQHLVKNCLAFDNVHDAFDQNHTKGNQTIYNCTAFRNGVNFQFPELPTTGNDVLKNNVSHSGPVALNGSAQQTANSWQGFTVTDADFSGLDTATATAARNSDFSLPNLPLLHLATGSDLIDAGVNVGLPFNGSAPDLGAYETSGGGTQPPAAPTGLTANAVSSSQINLAWTDNSTTETGFSIERSADGVNFSQIATVGANITSFSDTGLPSSTQFSYRVKAFNSGGNSAYSNTVGATTQAGGPAAPTGLIANPGNALVALNWNASAGATSYRVKRSTTSGGPYTTIVTNTTTSYTNSGLVNGTTYFFVVSAANSTGESSNSSQVSATPSAGPVPPAAPGNLIATPISSSQINLSWTDNANNETGFRIERATNAAGPFSQVGTAGANATAFQNTGLTANTTYFYRVNATNSVGASAFSNVASAATPPAGGGTTVTFESVGAEDGRILESSEGSNSGGSVNSSEATSAALRIGDDSSDRQYKIILSFDTSSIPDGATITAATVRLRRGSLTGSNPFTTHGNCFVDIKSGTGFNNSLSLQTGDFQAGADATQVATMSNPAVDGAVSSGTLNVTGQGLINKTGKTQFRVYFSLDDNDNAANDYIGWFSGNDSTAANRPTLEITYQ